MLATTRRVLNPRYPTWPEVPQDVVTVVCEGPSAHWSQAKLRAYCKGPVVAVNRAIAYPVPVDFWATADDPTKLWEWGQAFLHRRTRLFSTHTSLMIWSELLPDIRRVYHWPATEMRHPDLEDENGQFPLVPTLFHVLAWLLHLGTKEVRLLGADFMGSGTPFIEWSWKPMTDADYENRWAVERLYLARSMDHYRAKGARIVRWKKSKPVSL